MEEKMGRWIGFIGSVFTNTLPEGTSKLLSYLNNYTYLRLDPFFSNLSFSIINEQKGNQSITNEGSAGGKWCLKLLNIVFKV